jgi:hypothetical protein
LGAGELEHLLPHLTSEDRVAVADDRGREPVEADDVGEERSGDRRCRVWVPERDEVAIFGEAIDNRQHYRLVADLGEALNEIHRDIHPHRVQHNERLEEAHQMQMLCFVALINRAPVDEVPHQLVVSWGEEGGAQACQRLLDALMSHPVGML